MRTDNLQGSTAPASSAASAAFQTAFVQQKQFEETIARVNEKQTEAVKESTRKADRVKDVVDVNQADKTLRSSKDTASDGETSVPPAPAVGAKVNVSV